MDITPIIDWNGNGIIDPDDIAISLAMHEEDQKCEGYEDGELQGSSD